ncbi:hypothetical protein ADM98_01755 [Exiguobacterium sp. BMC-KP]|uniref:hypothetical protein n=1 Tax=Exiguobacterium sp. BMC-KP TaxID=1684312 RepID=UPI0006AA1EC4|nr:hypothetical protein [Exiguobacterium sp. BMC-KP]KOP31159.1 hypothetical protein ADM98_01755 [Exiguobacterium sp. BMC-KP]
MKNNFELEIDNTVTKLAGNPLGKKIYQSQVLKEIDYEKEIMIVFPDRIDTIASSFIQGFFEDMVSKIGVNGIVSQVTIKSSIPDIKDLIVKNLI